MYFTVVAPNSSATTVHRTRVTAVALGSDTARDAEPAVHRKDDARHERCRVAAQPLYRAHDLVGRAESPHGGVRDDRPSALRVGAVRIDAHAAVLPRDEAARRGGAQCELVAA